MGPSAGTGSARGDRQFTENWACFEQPTAVSTDTRYELIELYPYQDTDDMAQFYKYKYSVLSTVLVSPMSTVRRVLTVSTAVSSCRRLSNRLLYCVLVQVLVLYRYFTEYLYTVLVIWILS